MTTAPFVSTHDIVVGLWRLNDWKLDAAGLARWTEEVLGLGPETFDLADIYGGYTCEERFGEALAHQPGLRERLRIVTKCDIKLVSERRPAHKSHIYDTSREHIIASAENSLRVLGTDRLDLLLLHRQDPLMDPAEVAAAFDELYRAGKVLGFGVSNFTPSHLAMLASHVEQPLVTNQVEVSALHLEPFVDGTLDQALERRMRPMAWSPLGGGRLFTGEGEQEGRMRGALEQLARQRETSVDTLAYAFLLRHPSRMHPITGSGRLERIAAAVQASELELSREEWFDLWRASTGAPLP